MMAFPPIMSSFELKPKPTQSMEPEVLAASIAPLRVELPLPALTTVHRILTSVPKSVVRLLHELKLSCVF